MSSISTRKNIIHASSGYMLIALISLFSTGFLLILIVFLFGLPIFQLTPGPNFYIIIIQIFTVIILFLGLFIVSLGLFQSIKLIKSMKMLIDMVLSGKDVGMEQSNQQRSGIGTNLKIIRPSLITMDTEAQYQPTVSKKTTKTIEEQPKVQEKAPGFVEEKSAQKDQSIEISEKKPEEEALEISLEEALQKILERYNDPKVSSAFKSWDDNLMMTFPDVDKSYIYKINKDQSIDLFEGYDEEAAVQVKIDSDVFIKMMTKQINPIKAYSSGKLEVVGKMRSLLKLRKLMF